MSNSVDILINGKETVGRAADSALSGLGRLNEGLERTKSNLRSFNEILGLAFGFTIGRHVFEQLHDAIAGFSEDIRKARDEGLSWADSVDSATAHLLGLRNAFDVAKEGAKHYKEVIGELPQVIKSLKESVYGPPPLLFPFLAGGREKEGKLDEAKKALADKKKAYDISQADVESARNAYRNAPTTANLLAYRDAQTRNNATLFDYEQAGRDVGTYQRELGRQNAQAGLLSPFRSFLGALAIPGFGIGLNNLLPTIETRIEQGAARVGAGEGWINRLLWAPFSGLTTAFFRAVQARVDGDKDDFDPPTQTYRPHRLGSVAAQNARFLTRGAGPQKSPEAEALAAVNVKLDKISRTLNAWATSIGLANGL